MAETDRYRLMAYCTAHGTAQEHGQMIGCAIVLACICLLFGGAYILDCYNRRKGQDETSLLSDC